LRPGETVEPVARLLNDPAARAALTQSGVSAARESSLRASEIVGKRALSVTHPLPAELAASRRSNVENRRRVEDALLGYPVGSVQLADLLEDFSRLCATGWVSSEALRQAGQGARPELRLVIEATALRTAAGAPLSTALAEATATLPALAIPALRAWERNGQRDADLRTLAREMRRLGALEQRNTFFQIGSFIRRASAREQKSMAVRTTRMAEKRIDASRGGIARRSRATMRWTDLFVSLWRCGVPISEALEAAGDGCGNNYYRHVLCRAAERTREGAPLSACLAESRLLPVGLIDRLRTGEVSGRMDETLEEFARVMEGDAKELGGQVLFMRRILPAILIASAVIVFVYCAHVGDQRIALTGALIFLPIAFLVWEMVFRQSIAGAPSLGIGRRVRRNAERETGSPAIPDGRCPTPDNRHITQVIATKERP
jgi:type II secretory pathway component PulF